MRLGWTINTYEGCPFRKRKVWKWKNIGKTLCGDRGKDWSEAASSQRAPRIAGNHQK